MQRPVKDIGDWTTSELARFIEDHLERTPPLFFDGVAIGTLDVKTKLILPSQIDADQVWRFLGQVGQPGFTNSWVAHSFAPPRFLKDPFGWVHAAGAIKSGTIGSSAFTFPPDCRPAYAHRFAVAGDSVYANVQIGTNGTMTPYTPTTNTFVSLDNIHFKAA